MDCSIGAGCGRMFASNLSKEGGAGEGVMRIPARVSAVTTRASPLLSSLLLTHTHESLLATKSTSSTSSCPSKQCHAGLHPLGHCSSMSQSNSWSLSPVASLSDYSNSPSLYHLSELPDDTKVSDPPFFTKSQAFVAGPRPRSHDCATSLSYNQSNAPKAGQVFHASELMRALANRSAPPTIVQSASPSTGAFLPEDTCNREANVCHISKRTPSRDTLLPGSFAFSLRCLLESRNPDCAVQPSQSLTPITSVAPTELSSQLALLLLRGEGKGKSNTSTSSTSSVNCASNLHKNVVSSQNRRSGDQPEQLATCRLSQREFPDTATVSFTMPAEQKCNKSSVCSNLSKQTILPTKHQDGAQIDSGTASGILAGLARRWCGPTNQNQSTDAQSQSTNSLLCQLLTAAPGCEEKTVGGIGSDESSKTGPTEEVCSNPNQCPNTGFDSLAESMLRSWEPEIEESNDGLSLGPKHKIKREISSESRFKQGADTEKVTLAQLLTGGVRLPGPAPPRLIDLLRSCDAFGARLKHQDPGQTGKNASSVVPAPIVAVKISSPPTISVPISISQSLPTSHDPCFTRQFLVDMPSSTSTSSSCIPATTFTYSPCVTAAIPSYICTATPTSSTTCTLNATPSSSVCSPHGTLTYSNCLPLTTLSPSPWTPPATRSSSSCTRTVTLSSSSCIPTTTFSVPEITCSSSQAAYETLSSTARVSAMAAADLPSTRASFATSCTTTTSCLSSTCASATIADSSSPWACAVVAADSSSPHQACSVVAAGSSSPQACSVVVAGSSSPRACSVVVAGSSSPRACSVVVAGSSSPRACSVVVAGSSSPQACSVVAAGSSSCRACSMAAAGSSSPRACSVVTTRSSSPRACSVVTTACSSSPRACSVAAGCSSSRRTSLVATTCSSSRRASSVAATCFTSPWAPLVATTGSSSARVSTATVMSTTAYEASSSLFLAHTAQSSLLLTQAAPSSLPLTHAAPSSLSLTHAAPSSLPLPHAALSSLPLPHAAPSSLPLPHVAASSLRLPHVAPSSLRLPHTAPSSLRLPHAAPSSLRLPHAAPSSLRLPHAAPSSLRLPHEVPSLRPPHAAPPSRLPHAAPSSPLPHAGPSSLPLTHASPSSLPPTDAAPSSLLPTHVAPSSLPQAPTSSSPLPQAPTSSSLLPQVPSSSPPLTQAPISLPSLPQAPTSSSHFPQAHASSSPLPQAPASSSPLLQAPASSSPLPQAPASSSPLPQAPASSSPLPLVPASPSSLPLAPASPSLLPPAPASTSLPLTSTSLSCFLALFPTAPSFSAHASTSPSFSAHASTSPSFSAHASTAPSFSGQASSSSAHTSTVPSLSTPLSFPAAAISVSTSFSGSASTSVSALSSPTVFASGISSTLPPTLSTTTATFSSTDSPLSTVSFSLVSDTPSTSLPLATLISASVSSLFSAPPDLPSSRLFNPPFSVSSKSPQTLLLGSTSKSCSTDSLESSLTQTSNSIVMPCVSSSVTASAFSASKLLQIFAQSGNSSGPLCSNLASTCEPPAKRSSHFPRVEGPACQTDSVSVSASACSHLFHMTNQVDLHAGLSETSQVLHDHRPGTNSTSAMSCIKVPKLKEEPIDNEYSGDVAAVSWHSIQPKVECPSLPTKHAVLSERAAPALLTRLLLSTYSSATECKPEPQKRHSSVLIKSEPSDRADGETLTEPEELKRIICQPRKRLRTLESEPQKTVDNQAKGDEPTVGDCGTILQRLLQATGDDTRKLEAKGKDREDTSNAGKRQKRVPFYLRNRGPRSKSCSTKMIRDRRVQRNHVMWREGEEDGQQQLGKKATGQQGIRRHKDEVTANSSTDLAVNNPILFCILCGSGAWIQNQRNQRNHQDACAPPLGDRSECSTEIGEQVPTHYSVKSARLTERAVQTDCMPESRHQAVQTNWTVMQRSESNGLNHSVLTGITEHCERKRYTMRNGQQDDT
uniref:Uncharacterized protein n=1 Tax=Eptatretus burgeri TaxID=7764 RepID=A0A8C4QSE2_EPTBU